MSLNERENRLANEACRMEEGVMRDAKGIQRILMP
jgi:hypothetical protein